MAISKYRRIYFVFSGILIIASLVLLFGYGLKAGIDFTGGTIMELEYLDERPLNEEILAEISEFDLGTVNIQPTGEKGVILRMKEITEEKLDKYFSITKEALDKVKSSEMAVKRKDQALDFLDMAERYYSDAKHFKDKGDFVLAYGA